MGANNSSSKDKSQQVLSEDVPEIGIHRHSIDSVSAGDNRDFPPAAVIQASSRNSYKSSLCSEWLLASVFLGSDFVFLCDDDGLRSLVSPHGTS